MRGQLIGVRTECFAMFLAQMKNEPRDVRLAQAGDIDVFERLYRVHLPRVHRIARWLLRTNDVDDVIQEVFVRIWDKLETFDERSSLSTWLHRVAVNVILRYRERTTRYRAQALDLEDKRCEENGERLGLRLDLEAAVSSLPERARTVFVLHEIQGYSHDEIAKLMNTSVGTLRISTAR